MDSEILRDLQQREAITPPESEGKREGTIVTRAPQGLVPWKNLLARAVTVEDHGQ